jgi:transposase
VILEKLEQGLSAQRIYQDLVGDGFAHEYHSVRRFVAKLQRTSPLPFRRMECAPGEEAQIDFGTGAWIELPEGKRRRSHVFRIVLSHSRKGYSEAVYRQTTEDFIRSIENAFWHFGGVPKVLVIDNLKAAVKQPDWYDPELNPKIQSFCEHYGCVILPTKPRTPRHKGKIEAGVDYVQENGLKGHGFTNLEKENEHLLHWETTVADTRIHGTIRKQVGKLFHEVERSALLPLPLERFPFFHEGKRTVHRDGHVEVAKAYYSVPPEYLGHELWVRWDLRLVRIFNHRMEQIALHVRKEPGQFSTLPEHIHSQKRSGVERGAEYLLSRARRVGQHTARWAESMLSARGIEGVRVLQGLLALTKRHDAGAIERACEAAFSYGAWRLKTLRELLKRDAPEQETFAFLQEHPIIRPLSDYGKLVSTAFQRPPRTPLASNAVYCCSSLSNPQETW